MAFVKGRGLAVLIALAGCTPGAPPTPVSGDEANGQAIAVTVAGPDAEVAAGSLPAPELDGVVTTPGKWRRDRAADGDAAIFADRGGNTLFAVRCSAAKRRLLLVRAGVSANRASMKIVTASGAASYPALPRGFAPGVMANAAINDPFIATSLAQATGRIGVLIEGEKPLAVSANPVIGQLIGDCAANR